MKKLVLIACSICGMVGSAQQDKNGLAVMSFNIRYNNPDDGINVWENRKEWLTKSIRFFEADLVGAQEVTYTQLQDMEDLLPKYRYVGVGREGGNKGEFSPIFYRKDRFQLLESNTFWLSKTPEKVGSKGWDAALPRIVSWAKFKDKGSGKKFFLFNTHFDHRGKTARKKSAELIAKEIERIAGDSTVILTGDFNALPNSGPYAALTKNGLKDVFSDLDVESRYGTEYTTNGWDIEAGDERNRIDYVFYKGKKIVPIKYHVLDGQRAKRFISDHFPVLAHFDFTDSTKGVEVQNRKSLRIMAYNIHHANPPSRSDSIDIPAIVRTIRAQDPDLVALQEIDGNTERSGEGNQAEIIADSLNMNVFFGKAIDYEGGSYGVAILSKYPISERTVHRLPTDPGTNGEKRVLATVKVALSDKRFIRFGSTHLDSQKEDTDRMLQVREIQRIASKDTLPTVIAGDFNAPPNSKVIDILDETFVRTCIDCEPTIPVNDPERAIDFIAYRPERMFTVEDHKVIDETYASDHLPIVAELKYESSQ